MTQMHMQEIMVTVTIVPYKETSQGAVLASDAIVTLTADGYVQSENSITVPAGTKIHAVTTLTNYTSNDQYIVPYSDRVVEVKLLDRPQYSFSLTLTPNDVPFVLSIFDDLGNNLNQSTTFSAGTGTISVPENYVVKMSLVNPDDFELEAPETNFTWTVNNNVSYNRSLKAKVYFREIIPDQTDYMFSINDETFTRPNYSLEVITDCTNEVYWKVEKPGYNTESQLVPFIAGKNYFKNTALDVRLYLKQLHYTVGPVMPSGATVNIWVNGVLQPAGSLTVNCVMGDTIKWEVSAANYETQSSGDFIKNSVENDGSGAITLSPKMCNVSISSTPVRATVEILVNGVVVKSGTGTASINLYQTDTITYRATCDGISSEKTKALSGLSSFSDTLVLDASAAGVQIITSNQEMSLTPGKYFVIGVSAGGAGGVGTAFHQSQTTGGSFPTTVTYSAGGGGGGGSGGLSLTTATIVRATGGSVTFEVGTGGVYGVNSGNGGTSRATFSGTSGAGVQYFTISGGKGGGSSSGGNGGSGGSGGGAGGYHVAMGSGYVAGYDGGNGGIGGCNGANSGSNSGGKGYYDGYREGYASNRGFAINSVSDVWNSYGRGGQGLASMQYYFTTENMLRLYNSLVSSDTLRNSIAGGGGGGGSFIQDTMYSNAYGGPGAGGGGWYAGSNATAPDWNTGYSGTPGNGGSGAFIICKVDW